MKVSQLVFSPLFLFFSALVLYAGLTTQHKSWFDWFGITCSVSYLALFLLQLYLKDKRSKALYLKGNTLKIDVEAQEAFRAIVALGIIGFGIVFLFKLPSGLNILVFALALIGAYAYKNSNPAPGVYKNGKYLGNIYKGFIKVGDALTLGERQEGTIGYLKILKDGKVVALLSLTPEAFMELKPDKIHEVFPEIKGNIEKFEDLYKVGDYTLQYSLFTKSYEYDDEGGSVSDDFMERKHSPAYRFLPANTWHNA